MRLGILGAGAIGEKHVAAATAVGVEVTRVVDRNADRATALAATCGASADVDQQVLWDDDNLDAVVIGVPNNLHHPLTLEALRGQGRPAGKADGDLGAGVRRVD